MGAHMTIWLDLTPNTTFQIVGSGPSSFSVKVFVTARSLCFSSGVRMRACSWVSCDTFSLASSMRVIKSWILGFALLLAATTKHEWGVTLYWRCQDFCEFEDMRREVLWMLLRRSSSVVTGNRSLVWPSGPASALQNVTFVRALCLLHFSRKLDCHTHTKVNYLSFPRVTRFPSERLSGGTEKGDGALHVGSVVELSLCLIRVSLTIPHIIALENEGISCIL